MPAPTASETVTDEIALLRAYESRVDNPMIRAMALYAEAEAVSAAEPLHALRLFAEARELARTTGNRLVLGVAMAAETALLGRVGALDDRDREQDSRRRALLAGLGQREPLRHLSAQRGLAPRPARRPPSGRRAGGDDDHPDA